jgi:hypothetical protein
VRGPAWSRIFRCGHARRTAHLCRPMFAVPLLTVGLAAPARSVWWPRTTRRHQRNPSSVPAATYTQALPGHSEDISPQGLRPFTGLELPMSRIALPHERIPTVYRLTYTFSEALGLREGMS